ncbi:NUDIX domain-containing protein [Curtobacterium flaccumfaciens pv. flaccumfaciens]|nr:NUDIX domain-containing protein [Curtobacterium flaccumfaciens pv. flaccumfaciens]
MDEWWDLVDAAGAPTGGKFRRGDAGWPGGAFHLVVTVCVSRADGTVLLTQRAPTKEFAFGWEFPGGSAFAGETGPAAACRELLEETNVTVEPEALRRVGRFTEETALVDLFVAGAEWVRGASGSDRGDGLALGLPVGGRRASSEWGDGRTMGAAAGCAVASGDGIDPRCPHGTLMTSERRTRTGARWRPASNAHRSATAARCGTSSSSGSSSSSGCSPRSAASATSWTRASSRTALAAPAPFPAGMPAGTAAWGSPSSAASRQSSPAVRSASDATIAPAASGTRSPASAARSC